MNEIVEVQTAWTVLTAALVVAGAALTLTGAAGLLRLGSFYERAHAPTLGTTLGTSFIAIASVIYFSAGGGRVAIHELLIIIFVTATTPASLVILVGAARYREKLEDQTSSDENGRQPDTKR